MDMRQSEPPPPDEQRASERHEVAWAVDCETEDTFLFASITNVSEMGIFVRTDEPLPVGTRVLLRFAPAGADAPFVQRGRVQWVNKVHMFGDNPNPGMGILFTDLHREDRERLVAAIRTIAYLRGDPATYARN
jgi:type IV pilus assembly protein PilZ